MKGYVFDPSRLARSPKVLERDGYAVAGRMLREILGGGDIFGEVRKHAAHDPRLRAMFAYAADLLTRPSGAARPAHGRRRQDRQGTKP